MTGSFNAKRAIHQAGTSGDGRFNSFGLEQDGSDSGVQILDNPAEVSKLHTEIDELRGLIKDLEQQLLTKGDAHNDTSKARNPVVVFTSVPSKEDPPAS